MYSLFDKTSEEFNAPFLMKNDKLAIKAVKTFLAGKENQVTINDFDLYCVGTFDVDNGKVKSLFIPIDLKEQVNG